MKVLSIDLDYIFPMQPNNFGFDDECDEYYDLLDLVEENDIIQHPLERWKNINSVSKYRYQDFVYDTDKLKYIKYLYLTALKKCDNVGFGYEHDNILYELRDHCDIELINVDTHDDVINSDGGSVREEPIGACDEGNWIAWLSQNNKLKSVYNITGKIYKDKQHFIKSLLNCEYKTTDQKPPFKDVSFDYIFVCLSPFNTPLQYWNLFEKIIHTYEEYHGKVYDRNALSRKFEIDYRYEFLHQCPNDREQISVPWL